MTAKDKYAVAALAFTFISLTQDGADTFRDILNTLNISYEEFNNYVKQLPRNENTRYAIYNQIRKLSPTDKGTIRSILYDAYANGGKSKIDASYTAFYFREMIDKCDIANTHINL